MAYVSIWENLSDARGHVMANTGCSQEEAETDICRAMTEGAINFQGELLLHTTKRFKARGAVLEGTAFQLPTQIGRGDLDWEKSSPRQPWIVKRGHYHLPGHWQLERIRLSKADVRRALCATGAGDNSTQRDSGESDKADKVQLASSAEAHIAPDPKSTDRSQNRAMSARRRGRRPTKLTATIEAMRQDILSGQLTTATLENMLEKNLAAHYGVSRDTARKARDAVLSELNSRQNATNDK